MDPRDEPVISTLRMTCLTVLNMTEFLEFARQNFRNPHRHWFATLRHPRLCSQLPHFRIKLGFEHFSCVLSSADSMSQTGSDQDRIFESQANELSSPWKKGFQAFTVESYVGTLEDALGLYAGEAYSP